MADKDLIISAAPERAETALDVALGRAEAIRSVIEMPAKPAGAIDGTMVEIVRSFAYKMNVGNYESRDFFCSQKVVCKPEDAEAASEAAYNFCEREVLSTVQSYRKKREAMFEKKGAA